MTLKIIALLGTITIFSPNCAGFDLINLGPRTQTELVIVNPGNPVLVIENRKVKSVPYTWDGTKAVELKVTTPPKVDVGGWIAMPKAHFEALMRRLDQLEKANGVK